MVARTDQRRKIVGVYFRESKTPREIRSGSCTAAEGEEMKSIPWSPDEDERLRTLALSGASVAERAKPSLADFTTTTPELKFSVPTARALAVRLTLNRIPTACWEPLRLWSDLSRD